MRAHSSPKGPPPQYPPLNHIRYVDPSLITLAARVCELSEDGGVPRSNTTPAFDHEVFDESCIAPLERISMFARLPLRKSVWVVWVHVRPEATGAENTARTEGPRIATQTIHTIKRRVPEVFRDDMPSPLRGALRVAVKSFLQLSVSCVKPSRRSSRSTGIHVRVL